MTSAVDLGCVVVPLRGGRATLRELTGMPTHTPWDRGVELATGTVDAVVAAANLLRPGGWRHATCITPNGRLDGHGSYVNGFGGSTGARCSFCHEPVGVTPPDACVKLDGAGGVRSRRRVPASKAPR